jgi:hypothetical protein
MKMHSAQRRSRARTDRYPQSPARLPCRTPSAHHGPTPHGPIGQEAVPLPLPWPATEPRLASAPGTPAGCRREEMRVVGLTGGIACGKSTVTKLLLQRGFPVIDCDLLARDVVKKVRRRGGGAAWRGPPGVAATHVPAAEAAAAADAAAASAGQVGLEARGQGVRHGRAVGDG